MHNSQYSSEITITKEELKNKIKEKHSDFFIDFSKEDCIKITEYTEGNRVKNLKIGNLNFVRCRSKKYIWIKVCKF